MDSIALPCVCTACVVVVLASMGVCVYASVCVCERVSVGVLYS